MRRQTKIQKTKTTKKFLLFLLSGKKKKKGRKKVLWHTEAHPNLVRLVVVFSSFYGYGNWVMCMDSYQPVSAKVEFKAVFWFHIAGSLSFTALPN